MAYLKSTQVKVYPSAYRGVNDKGELFNPESQLNTEFNITNLQANDSYLSYVISWEDSILKCVIHGYYFELTLDTTTVNGFTSNIWVSINIQAANTVDATNTTYAAYTLVPYTQATIGIPSKLDDTNGDFIGLNLTEERPTSGATTTLHILHKTNDSSWQVPEESWCILNTTQIKNNATNSPISKSFTTETLKVSGKTTTQGNVDINGDLVVSGSTTLSNTLSVQGDINISQGALTADGLTITEDGSITNLESDTITTNVIYPQGSNTEIGGGQNDGDRFDKIYGKDIYATTFHGELDGDVPDLRENITDIRLSLGSSQNAIALTNQSVLIYVLVNDYINSVYTFHLILEDNLHKLGSTPSGYTTTLIDFGQLCWGIRNLSVDYRVQATAKLSDLASTNPKTYDYIIEIHGEYTENPNTVNLYVDVYWYDSNALRWKRLESGNLYVSTTCRIIN